MNTNVPSDYNLLSTHSVFSLGRLCSQISKGSGCVGGVFCRLFWLWSGVQNTVPESEGGEPTGVEGLEEKLLFV